MTTATRLDPRLSTLSLKHLELAADMVRQKRPSVTYWNEFPVPLRPDDAVPYEGLRRVAVFLPLVAVVLAYFLLHSPLAALAAFAVALPLMVVQDRALRRDMRRAELRNRAVDGGRYAFTKFMCSEFGLRPQEVNLALLRNMLNAYTVHVRATRKAGARPAVRTYGGAAATGFAGALPVAEVAYADEGHVRPPAVNPVTGLPMLNDTVDVNGNVYGTSSQDDLLRVEPPAPVFDYSWADHSSTDYSSPDMSFAHDTM